MSMMWKICSGSMKTLTCGGIRCWNLDPGTLHMVSFVELFILIAETDTRWLLPPNDWCWIEICRSGPKCTYRISTYAALITYHMRTTLNEIKMEWSNFMCVGVICANNRIVLFINHAWWNIWWENEEKNDRPSQRAPGGAKKKQNSAYFQIYKVEGNPWVMWPLK